MSTSGAMAPALASAIWFSVWSRASDCSPAAAYCCVTDDSDVRSATSGVMPPALAIAPWLSSVAARCQSALVGYSYESCVRGRQWELMGAHGSSLEIVGAQGELSTCLCTGVRWRSSPTSGGMPSSSVIMTWLTMLSFARVASAPAATLDSLSAAVIAVFDAWLSSEVTVLSIVTSGEMAPSSAICVCVSGLSRAISESARAAT